MEAKASYFRIGLFVITSAVLVFASIIVLGAGALTHDVILFETYLDESIQGLDKGAAVRYRGVKIGSVTRIGFVQGAYETDRNYVMLDMEFIEGSVDTGTDDLDWEERKGRFDGQIQDGLRIRVASAGLTGAMYLEIDFINERDLEKYPPLGVEWKPNEYYIPSIASTSKRLSESAEGILQDLDEANFQDVTHKLTELLDKMNMAMENEFAPILENINDASKDLPSAIADFRRLMNEDIGESLKGFLSHLEEVTSGIDKNLAAFLDEVGEASVRVGDDAHKALSHLDEGIQNSLTPALKQIHEAADGLPAAVSAMRRASVRLDRILAAQEAELGEVFENLRLISANVREMTDMATKYPSRLLFGDAPPRRKGLGK